MTKLSKFATGSLVAGCLLALLVVPWSLYKSVGFGFRWFSPIGPLRFEWGIPLNRRRDRLSGAYLDNAIDFQFTIGSFF